MAMAKKSGTKAATGKAAGTSMTEVKKAVPAVKKEVAAAVPAEKKEEAITAPVEIQEEVTAAPAEKKEEAAAAPAENETAVKKEPVKKVPAKKEETKSSIFVEFDGKQLAVEEILETAKNTYAKGHKGVEIKTIDLYVKPEEGVAYYAVNGIGTADDKINL